MTPPRLSRTGSPVVSRRIAARPRPATRNWPPLPPVSRLAVVTCFYNPTGLPLLVDNFHRFRDGLDVPLFTVEVSYSRRFELNADIHIHGKPETQLLWQKERLLNIAESELPDEYDAIAWIDADVLFDNPDWPQQTLDVLQNHHVCQLWSTASESQPDGSTLTMKPSVCSGWVDGAADWKRLDVWHPGLAWAMRRDTWRSIRGLLESNVIGNGDTHMLRGFLNADLWSDSHLTPAWLDDCNRWRQRTAAVVQNRVGVVPGHIRHLWHGPRQGRRYLERLKYLAEHSYDPLTDICVGTNGLLEWTRHALEQKPEMVAAVCNYFHERQQEPTNA